MVRFLKFWLILVLAWTSVIGLWCHRQQRLLISQTLAIPPVVETVSNPSVIIPKTSPTQTWPAGNSCSDAELLRLARQILARSPEEALAWAMSPNEMELRQRCINAVLQAWGEADPHSALQWIWTRSDTSRDAEMKALLAGAVLHPEIAMQTGWEMLTENPDAAGVYATFLSRTLAANGQYATALQFINGLSLDTAPDAIHVLFQSWTSTQPLAAMQAAEDLTDPAARTAALQIAAKAWSQQDPAALAAYSQTLAAGSDRAEIVAMAINNWSLQDPAGLGTWLNTLPPGDEFDQGVSAMLVRSDSANRTTETAMAWVESMTDPTLKQDALARVLVQWNQTDPSAAQAYVVSADWLSDGQRAIILNDLTGTH